MNQHFLQSPAWETFQQALGRTTFRNAGNGWEYMAILEKGTFNTRLYVPGGPSALTQSHFQLALKHLQQLGREQNVTFIRIDPTDVAFAVTLSKQGWKSVSYLQLQPEHSSVIDLTQPEDQLIANMSQPARNSYRNYQKKGLRVQTSRDPKDISILLDFVHQVAERNGIRPQTDAYFQQQVSTLFPLGAATLWYATLDSTPVAAALMFDSTTTRYYAHAGASSLPEHRKLNAGTALLTEAIIDAKRHNLTRFDLYGTAPLGSPPSHPWHGFTSFKNSFGGTAVTFGGTWDLPLLKPTYWLYRMYQSLRR